MESKEYLESYKRIAERLKILTTEIERLRTEAESVSINLDGMPRSSGKSDKIARLAIQLASYETQLADELSHLWSKRMEIIHNIGMLDHRHQLLLHKRYIDSESWEQIAYEMHITWRHCYRLHGRALAELEKIINKS